MQNVVSARARNLPYVREVAPHGRRLAVVGGGPSIADHLEEIRSETDVWAINGACRWLRERGIESTLVSVDPVAFLAERVVGATKAILCSRCDPAVFDALHGAEIRLVDLSQDDLTGGHSVWASASTAAATFQLSTDLGYRETVFYGCEGSYSDRTHAYMDEPELQEFRFVVSCGGREYLTAPDLYAQTLSMAPVLRMYRGHFTERSGGLLRAIVENAEHEIVKAPENLCVTP